MKFMTSEGDRSGVHTPTPEEKRANTVIARLLALEAGVAKLVMLSDEPHTLTERLNILSNMEHDIKVLRDKWVQDN